MKDLIDAGKVKYFGLSEAGLRVRRDRHAQLGCPLAARQPREERRGHSPPDRARRVQGRHRRAARLAWLLAQGEHIVPIPGTRSAERVEENVGAADLMLTDTDLTRIKEILPADGFGSRYSDGMNPNWQ